LRPVITGWFAAFADLESAERSSPVPYSADDWRFSGATYDPTSHYRAAEVMDFFDEAGLSPEFLRLVSQHQVGRLCRRFDELDLDPAVVARDRTAPLERLGGFLALRSPHAAAIQRGLAARSVLTDHRREVLRFGPAPYLSDRQLDEAMTLFGEVVRDLGRGAEGGGGRDRAAGDPRGI
jgi:kynureninase